MIKLLFGKSIFTYRLLVLTECGISIECTMVFYLLEINNE